MHKIVKIAIFYFLWIFDTVWKKNLPSINSVKEVHSMNVTQKRGLKKIGRM